MILPERHDRFPGLGRQYNRVYIIVSYLIDPLLDELSRRLYSQTLSQGAKTSYLTASASLT